MSSSWTRQGKDGKGKRQKPRRRRRRRRRRNNVRVTILQFAVTLRVVKFRIHFWIPGGSVLIFVPVVPPASANA
jgi:hypothetical protein